MDVIATTNNSSTPGTTAIILSVPETERNGVLKRPKYQPQVGPGYGEAVYKECLKNHAASSGGHALDGCGEFMPARTATPTDPTSLKCAACGCHRNFHRREKVSPAAAAATTRLIEYHPQHRHHPPQPLPPTLPAPPSPGSDDDQSPPPISSAYYPASAPHMLLALSDNAKVNNAAAAAAAAVDNGVCQQQQQQQQQHQQQQHLFSSASPHLTSRKRFRTKFSPDQKERMQEFAEKLGWKMQKSTDDLVKGFCNDIGVQREVFKVWMHNNKNTFGRRSASNYVITASNQGGISINNNVNPIKGEDYENVNENGIGIGVGNSHSSSINNSNCISDHQQQQFNNGMSHHSNAAPTNASSSSS